MTQDIQKPDDKRQTYIQKSPRDPNLWIYVKSCAIPSSDLWPDLVSETPQLWPHLDIVTNPVVGQYKMYTSTDMARCTKNLIGRLNIYEYFIP